MRDEIKMLENMITNLSEAELEKCFEEILEWRKTGVLSEDSLVRRLWNQFKEESGNKAFPIYLMSEPIFYEIAYRHYKV